MAPKGRFDYHEADCNDCIGQLTAAKFRIAALKSLCQMAGFTEYFIDELFEKVGAHMRYNLNTLIPDIIEAKHRLRLREMEVEGADLKLAILKYNFNANHNEHE